MPAPRVTNPTTATMMKGRTRFKIVSVEEKVE